MVKWFDSDTMYYLVSVHFFIIRGTALKETILKRRIEETFFICNKKYEMLFSHVPKNYKQMEKLSKINDIYLKYYYY